MVSYLKSFFSRFKILTDKSAWALFLPAVIGLFFIDPAMVKTLLQWTIFAPALAGLSIIISRAVFPQINLSDLLKEVTDENSTAASIVIGALIIFVGILFFALVQWAKA